MDPAFAAADGPRIAILTRPAGRNEALAGRLQGAGWQPCILPALEIHPLAVAAEDLPRPSAYDLVVFVSGNAARQYLDQLARADGARRLEALATERHLFPSEAFPAPAPGARESSTRYRLNPDDGDDDLALYLNAINPGKTTVPHNHTTWAVIVALSGAELNRVYRRTDDGATAGVARLEQVREVLVEPGQAIAFLPDDIHSIHVVDGGPTLHFHLYGRPLETLDGRIGIQPETGEIINYNASQLTPSVEVRA
ncbi:cysteine dioxygenase [Achromobacter sp. KAs 3-5]|nr:cysteine dioxygenase [Achromobacter sp. KAs 3-5]